MQSVTSLDSFAKLEHRFCLNQSGVSTGFHTNIVWTGASLWNGTSRHLVSMRVFMMSKQCRTQRYSHPLGDHMRAREKCGAVEQYTIEFWLPWETGSTMAAHLVPCLPYKSRGLHSCMA